MNNSLNNQQGVSLIEVLVSLIILAVTILGFIALQVNSVKLTSESYIRVSGLTLVRDFADKIRANPAGKDKYETKINEFYENYYPTTGSSTTPTSPVTKCGLNGSTITKKADLCLPDQQAEIDAYMISKRAFNDGYKVRMQNCPKSQTNGTMQTKCLIVAWNQTKPAIGANTGADVNCMSTEGLYYEEADCMIMEIL